MQESFINTISIQAKQVFRNIQSVFDYVDDDILSAGLCKWPLWRQLFHMLHSMDQWFISPFEYEDGWENGHQINALNTEIDMPAISRKELLSFFLRVEAKVEDYLTGLTDSDLFETPTECRFTRFELILGQFRHINFHIGMIHGCILMKNGEIPDYFGISNPVEPLGNGRNSNH